MDMTAEKTREDLQEELDLANRRADIAEAVSKALAAGDLRYAPILVKVIVYGFCGLILVAVAGALIALVVAR
jgi:hypothetical protein